MQQWPLAPLHDVPGRAEQMRPQRPPAAASRARSPMRGTQPGSHFGRLTLTMYSLPSSSSLCAATPQAASKSDGSGSGSRASPIHRVLSVQLADDAPGRRLARNTRNKRRSVVLVTRGAVAQATPDRASARRQSCMPRSPARWKSVRLEYQRRGRSILSTRPVAPN